ncbi:MAG: hypothetical protein RIS47_299 [Bacteroidota bacterium]|jgi:hypothetical protein
MTTLRSLTILLLCLLQFNLWSQPQQYLVIHSSQRYISALLAARQASRLLDIPLNTRSLEEDPTLGLSLNRSQCITKNGKLQYPNYPLRGPQQEGIYVSIEYSSPYPGWTPGYYLVIVASGLPTNTRLNQLLLQSQKLYGDAYYKTIEWIKP